MGAAKVPVICVETGVIYDSQASAARENGVSPSDVARSAKKGYAARGRHFRYAQNAGGQPSTAGRQHPVWCMETGEAFESQVEAAKMVGAHPSQISRSVRSGSRVHGLTFSSMPPPATKGVLVICVETAAVHASIRAAFEGALATLSACRPPYRGWSSPGIHIKRADMGPKKGSPRAHAGRRVRRVDTGETFDSIAKAAASAGTHADGIRRAADCSGTCAGIPWEWA